MLSFFLLILTLTLATVLWREIVAKKQAQSLFNSTSTDLKSSQEKIQVLLGDMNSKAVLMERASQALENSNTRLAVLDSENQSLKQALDFQIAQYEKLVGQSKSSQVRVGMITEQLAPFLNDYPLEPSRARFLGDPIDLVSFGDDKITFVEIKSGNAQLNKRQRQIRDLIAAGKVDFLLYRVKGEE